MTLVHIYTIHSWIAIRYIYTITPRGQSMRHVVIWFDEHIKSWWSLTSWAIDVTTCPIDTFKIYNNEFTLFNDGGDISPPWWNLALNKAGDLEFDLGDKLYLWEYLNNFPSDAHAAFCFSHCTSNSLWERSSLTHFREDHLYFRMSVTL